MPKTINVRIENNIYSIFRKAAEIQKRTMPDYIKYAALNYTLNETNLEDTSINDISAVLRSTLK